MAIATAGAPDLAAIKQRQQATWASGRDYHMIGTQILLAAEQLIESLDVRSTDRVLDVATGSGNAALAAARRGCEVVGIDYVPSLLDRARERAVAEGVQAQFEDGDAEAIPFEDDTSTSSPRSLARCSRRARRLPHRSCPGHPVRRQDRARHPHARGLHREPVQGDRQPRAATRGLRSPIQWGTEERLRELFGDTIAELRLEKRHMTFRYRSPQTWVDYWRRYYGPTLKAFEAVGEEGRPALEADLLENIARFNRADDNTMVVPSEYLESVIVVLEAATLPAASEQRALALAALLCVQRSLRQGERAIHAARPVSFMSRALWTVRRRAASRLNASRKWWSNARGRARVSRTSWTSSNARHPVRARSSRRRVVRVTPTAWRMIAIPRARPRCGMPIRSRLRDLVEHIGSAEAAQAVVEQRRRQDPLIESPPVDRGAPGTRESSARAGIAGRRLAHAQAAEMLRRDAADPPGRMDSVMQDHDGRRLPSPSPGGQRETVVRPAPSVLSRSRTHLTSACSTGSSSRRVPRNRRASASSR